MFVGMTPEQATFLLHEVYLPQMRNEQKTTQRIIAAVPADKGSYKPDERSMSAWELAKHIAGSEMFFMGGVSNGVFNRADGAVPDTVTTPSALAAWYDDNFIKAAEKVAATKPEDLAKNVNFVIFNLPAIAYAGFMMSHSIHHRGQLSAYLRPMGAKVPRIYGGSADEPLEIPQGQGN
jgi:uncharacterized damage-inducible protein DinB